MSMSPELLRSAFEIAAMEDALLGIHDDLQAALENGEELKEVAWTTINDIERLAGYQRARTRLQHVHEAAKRAAERLTDEPSKSSHVVGE